MGTDHPILSEASDGVRIDVSVQPRASRSGFAGVHEGRLKVRIAAPPVDGEANEELTRFLARFFELPRSAVTILQGHRGKRKRVHLTGVSLESVRAKLRGHQVLD